MRFSEDLGRCPLLWQGYIIQQPPTKGNRTSINLNLYNFGRFLMRGHGLDLLDVDGHEMEIGVIGASEILLEHGDIIPEDLLLGFIFADGGFARDTAIPHFTVYKTKFNLGVSLGLLNGSGAA